MKIQRTRDILDAVVKFHRNLSEFYEDLGGLSHRKRIGMLLDYMARHEKNLMKAINEYEQEAPEAILECWIQYSPEVPNRLPCERIQIHSEMDPDEVVQMALEFDDCIIHIFEEVLQSSEQSTLRAVFKNLLKMERQSLKQIVTHSLQLSDM